MDHRIIIYIPTWKRPQVIERVLSEELEFLSELNIDICIYDSSPDNETYRVVHNYESQYSNLRYESVDECIPSNEKYFNICQKEADGEYEYVWIIQDHMIFTKATAEYLLQMLEHKSDFYYLDMMSDQNTYTIEEDLNEFAVKSAWMLTRFGTAILRTDSFLKEIDWNDKRKWLNKKTINNSHIGLYFERLAEMKNPKVETISFVRDQFYDFMRFQPVAWNCALLRICLECWGTTICRLPSIYKKKEILQSQDTLFISTTQLLLMKDEHRYGIGAYLRYRKWIEKIYPSRVIEFRDVAFWAVKKSEKKYFGRILEVMYRACGKNEKIFIYGAGRHAVEFSRYVNYKNIPFEAFLVSCKEGNPKMIGEHPVIEASNMEKDVDALVIIAVAESGVEPIRQRLKTLQNTKLEVISLT